MQVEGGELQTLKPGDVFFEPAGAVVDQFSSGLDGVELLAYSLLGTSEVPQMKMLNQSYLFT